MDASAPNNIVDLNVWQNNRNQEGLYNRSERMSPSMASKPELGGHGHNSMLYVTSPFAGSNNKKTGQMSEIFTSSPVRDSSETYDNLTNNPSMQTKSVVGEDNGSDICNVQMTIA